MRIIHYSNSDGSVEGIFVTEDDDLDSSGVLPPGCTVDNDFDPSEGFPAGFPTEYNLNRV